MEVLLKLVLAHLLSDFFLQSKCLCECKKKKYPQNIMPLLIHSGIVSLVSYLILADWNNWIVPVILFLTHFIIDFIKTFQKDKLCVFISDQCFHLVVIMILSVFFSENICSTGVLKILLILVSYLLVLKPISIFLSLFFKSFNIESPLNGLKGAGKWIGYLERILILTFILTGNIECVGFLLAAKSIFRFGELRNKSEVQFTEYVLLGTFASFTVAVLVGFMSLEIMKLI